MTAADDEGVEDLMAFATSAVRDCRDSAQVLSAVRDQTGVALQVLPGDDEHALHERIKPVERRLLIDVVRRIADGELDLAAVR